VAFITWYRDGRLLTANQQFFQMTGYTESEVNGIRWPVDFTTPASGDRITRAMDVLDKGEKAYRHDEELIRKDGSRVPIEAFVHLYYPDQQPEHYYSFIADITQRKEREEAFKRSRYV
jgi:PAS domain S-box-containing protein